MFRGNVGLLLNRGDNLVAVGMEKAEAFSTFLPKSSWVMITPRFPAVPGLFGKE